ncbi:Voltage-gated Ion Channel (VIC) Superfamily [Achlya hypogyna]|uniref:Voltage-gated Ion Channel (VIC) Superfamily n=1 Tax=Achlya hypogyna TaxID=1202772 RepID=A0A1V9ZQX8_ACHHY|nr:Voltage-gated Ion Channel (VIC) Superfamily [Achlya hypogyna]
MGVTKLPSPRPPVSPRVDAIYREQIRRRSEANDPLWQRATSSLNNLKSARSLRAKRYRIETWMTFFAMVSVVAAAVSMQLSIVQTTKAVSFDGVDSVFAIEVLRSIIATCTIFLYGLMFLRFDTVCSLRISSSRLHPHARFYHPSSGLVGKAVVELLVLSLHVPPHFARTFIANRFMGAPSLDDSGRFCDDGLRLDPSGFCYLDLPWSTDAFDVIVFLRLYVLFRMLRHQLGFESPDIEFQGSQWHVRTSSFWFTVKYMFHAQPVFFSAVCFGTTWVCTGLIVEFLEHSINPDIDSATEALWLAVLTMATVGLGSTPPSSLQGQVAIVAGGIVGGAIMNALLTSVLISSLRVTEAEESVIDVIDARKHHLAHHETSIALLQAFGRHVLVRSQAKSSSRGARSTLLRVHRAAVAFKVARSRLQSRSHDDVLDLCRDTVADHVAAVSTETSATLEAIEHKLLKLQHRLQLQPQYML